MRRKGRKYSGKKLEPPLPEVQAELNLPKYFGVIKGDGYNKAEERREVVPGPMPRSGETPRAISGRRALKHPVIYPAPAPEPEEVPLVVRAARYIRRQPLLQPAPYPAPAPEPERVPLLIRAARYIGAIVKVEPERPVPMPVVPELNFPALYTRFPVMKTVTKTTDVSGEISVTYAQSYSTIPGVVITVKDPDNVFGTVFSTTLTGFEVRLFKMGHDHGGTVDDGGKHTPTINADGQHAHNVTGSLSWTEDSKYGRLVLANNTDYEKDHVHPNHLIYTYFEKLHTHTNPATNANNRGHVHSLPAWTGGPDDTDWVLENFNYGTPCGDGSCAKEKTFLKVALDSHYNALGGDTDGESQNHTHTQGNTGGVVELPSYPGHRHRMASTDKVADPGHRHLISNDDLYDHYITGISNVDLSLLVTANEDPYHGHTAVEVPVHAHVVAEDGRVLLVNTNVTITYIAQEESS